MKRILFLFCFTWLASVGLAKADGGSFYGDLGREKVWRTTITASCDQNVSVASGSIVIGGFLTGTPGSSSNFEIFDGQISTQTAIKALSRIDTTSKLGPDGFRVFLSSGFLYNNNGSGCADVTVFWDWASPQSVNLR